MWLEKTPTCWSDDGGEERPLPDALLTLPSGPAPSLAGAGSAGKKSHPYAAGRMRNRVWRAGVEKRISKALANGRRSPGGGSSSGAANVAYFPAAMSWIS